MDIYYRGSLILTLFTIVIHCKTAWSLNAGLLAYKSASFSVPSECALCEPKFNRFIIHNGTRDVYIGASNSLTRVDSNYNEIKTISTRVDCGDLIDEEDCINHNKLLSIFYGTDKLITCGSLNDGKCQIRDTSDISIAMEESETVVPSGELGTAYVIAPGMISDSLQEVLYVAATLDPGRRGTLPHVCRRILAGTAQYALSIPDKASVTWNPNTPNDFVISAVDGFVYKGYTYFLTNQEHDFDILLKHGNDGWNNVIPKIKRVCQKSKTFDSYTDIGMRCQGKDGTTYNLIQDAYIGEAGSDLAYSLDMNPGQSVLYAVFAKSVQETNNKPNNQSAICIYDLNDIAEEFVKAIELCLMSEEDANGTIYLNGRKCDTNVNAALARSSAPFEQCTARNYALPNGHIDTPVISETIMEWPDTLLSSIITTTERHHTIAFIGSVRGELLKMHIQRANESRVYETLSLGSPVLKDPALDVPKQHITVLTEQTIFKLMVENCGYYTTCDECIGNTKDDGDPYCGWCTLQSRCTRWHNCSLPDESTRWLSYNEAQCSGISKVLPFDSQPISTPHKITVTVEQLPDLGADKKYECVFELGNISLASTATKTGKDLECMTPDTADLPGIPSETDHVTMLLSIRSTETDVKFVDTNHTFYECATHKRCIDCTSSNWACDWCTYGDICTHDKDQCPNDNTMSLIAGEKHHKVNPPRRGPAECAQIELHEDEALLATEVDREINITVKNLPDMNQVLADSYECILYIEGKEQKAVAHRTDEETVKCNKTQFTYKADIQELRANLTLHWTWGGSRRTIDDEFGFEVTLFKCEVLRPDCSRCVSVLSSRHELRCGWCSEAEMCAVEDQPKCTGFWIRETPDLGVETKNCPMPNIHSIWPTSGPIEGNTLLEINGTDFGRSFNNIVSVTVAGRQCMHSGLENMFDMSERLFCYTTMAMEADETGDVLITVQGLDDSDQVNDGGKLFTYRDPDIVDFGPGYGPAAGGTMVTIKGTYLMAGRDIDILVGNTSCSIVRDSSSSSVMTCLSGASYADNISPIKMIFDASERRSNDVYSYRANPVVDSVNPFSAFKAGGRVITVEGSNLDVVQTPQVRVAIGRDTYTETCKLVNKSSSIMTCPSPKVYLPTKQKRQADGEQAVLADLGFIMDGVRDLLVWNDNSNITSHFRYFEDPYYPPFTSNKSLEAGELLQIEGERLSLASTEADVTVYIGDEKCTNISLGLNTLTCNIPAKKPGASDTYKVFIIQGNLNFSDIGSVTYKPIPPTIILEIIVGIAAVVFVLLVVIGIITVIFRYRVKHARQQTRKLLNEMEKLEDSMASRIRDAFAQLQLDLHDLTSDLEGTGMPFVTNEQYATNMIFTGIRIKPSTTDPIDIDDRKERAMAEFGKLLGDKNFLSTFIQVLDSPSSAPAPVIRERTKIACFLTTLMIIDNKLPYLTDVMITLLTKHIEEVVEDEKAVQLCQRTETVVDRLLTNWVSVCLFKHLKDLSGLPLFVLYRAVMLQTDKGPVDIVNGKAYYSLSEHSVLQLDNVEYKTISLQAIVNDGDGESKEVKVTELDTISQVKEKLLDLIYRNKAYSQRPDISLVDLEWRQGRGGKLILRDDDQTTEKDETYKKINTLQHYKISDGAKVALVLKQNVPNAAIDATVLRRSIFVREKDDEESEYENTVQVRNPRVSLYHRRDRARYTVYELNNVPLDDPDRGLTAYHLVKEEEDFEFSNRKSWAAAKKRLSRRVSDAIKQRQANVRKIHYPQLLTTKGATQEYVDNMFKAVLDKDHVPKTMKYMFDFLETEAQRHKITDKETIHKWKSNCLTLRFWVTIINNPQYIFDIRESRSVTDSLGVVGQAFFDAFNRTDHTNTTETGFNKLLYHKDLEHFQSRVDAFYDGVSELPAVDTTEMAEELDKISQQFTGVFSKLGTLTQLYHFAQMNNEKLIDALEDDDMCSRAKLASRLENISAILEGESV